MGQLEKKLREGIMGWYGINRTLCAALEDMRKAYDTYNFASMKSLIEEVQMLGNRMEGALEDVQDLEYLKDEISALKKELKELKKKKKEMDYGR
jgi:cell shape-determining protein MreC